MPLRQRLDRWVDHGLLDRPQADAILAFEGRQRHPSAMHAIAGLGGLAIAVGLVSIVASNWDVIPGAVKIGIDLALVGGLGLWLRRVYPVEGGHGERPSWLPETLIVVMYGLVLASIGLIGQVYQLGGETHVALATWTLLTALLVTRGHHGLLATVWAIGLVTTSGTWLAWLADRGDGFVETLALALVYWIPLASLLAGRWSWLRRVRPAFASVFQALGWAGLVGCGMLGTFAFYERTYDEDWIGIWPGLAGSVAATGWLWHRTSSAARHAIGGLLGACLVLSHIPLLVSPGDLDVVAAISFVGLWGLVALVAHRTGQLRLLNLATAVIGIRIVVVYFEVFGSLLDTGLGLVTGGLLTLGLVWIWARKRKDFAADVEERDGARGGTP